MTGYKIEKADCGIPYKEFKSILRAIRTISRGGTIYEDDAELINYCVHLFVKGEPVGVIAEALGLSPEQVLGIIGRIVEIGVDRFKDLDPDMGEALVTLYDEECVR
jgi:hypothetical protein